MKGSVSDGAGRALRRAHRHPELQQALAARLRQRTLVVALAALPRPQSERAALCKRRHGAERARDVQRRPAVDLEAVEAGER